MLGTLRDTNPHSSDAVIPDNNGVEPFFPASISGLTPFERVHINVCWRDKLVV